MPLFNRGMFHLVAGGGGMDWTTANVDMLLVDDTYVFDPDDNFVSDLVVDEISTTNYTRQDMTARTITENDTSDEVEFDAADFSISNLGPASGGPTVGGAVAFEFNAADAAATLIAFVDLTDTTVNGGDFTIQWATNGVFYADSP
jgi:hypothetical protein